MRAYTWPDAARHRRGPRRPGRCARPWSAPTPGSRPTTTSSRSTRRDMRGPHPAGTVRDGQAGRGLDPLLRRPFSVFEILRDDARRADRRLDPRTSIVGTGTGLLYELEPGERLACLGPLGRPFTPPPADRAGWLVAGGVGLAPFATLAEALPRARPAADAVLRRAARRRPALRRLVRRARRRRPRRHRGRQRRRARLRHGAARPARSRRWRPAQRRRDLRVRADADDARRRRARRPPRPRRRGVARADDGLRHGRLLQLRRAGRAADGRPPHFVRSCLAGPTFRGSRARLGGAARIDARPTSRVRIGSLDARRTR